MERKVKAVSIRTRTSGAVWFAYAAGIAGVVANAFLIAFYAFQVGRPVAGVSFGSANDLVGSLATACMIPVAFALFAGSPDRSSGRIVHAVGVAAMSVLTVGGPLLVAGVVAFEVQAPIMVAAWMILCLWLLLINRWSRLSGVLPRRTARFGEFLGAGTLLGGALVGVGLLLPWMSWAQWAMFSAALLVGLPTWLGTPVWFLLLG